MTTGPGQVVTDGQEVRTGQLDTYEGDPISGFRLASADFLTVGDDLARTGLPTVFVFEGGYAVDALGINAVNVLEGFTQRRG